MRACAELLSLLPRLCFRYASFHHCSWAQLEHDHHINLTKEPSSKAHLPTPLCLSVYLSLEPVLYILCLLINHMKPWIISYINYCSTFYVFVTKLSPFNECMLCSIGLSWSQWLGWEDPETENEKWDGSVQESRGNSIHSGFYYLLWLLNDHCYNDDNNNHVLCTYALQCAKYLLFPLIPQRTQWGRHY